MTDAKQVSLSLEDFMRLLSAAEYGVAKAKGFHSDAVVRGWSESVERLTHTPLPSTYATDEERDAAFLADTAKQCEMYGAD